MIYFTADLHFYHDNVIRFANRPFENSQQMNKALIKNWNDKIKPTDEVYILGDFTMKGHALAQEILYQLKGKKHLIKGNWHRKSFISSKARNILSKATMTDLSTVRILKITSLKAFRTIKK